MQRALVPVDRGLAASPWLSAVARNWAALFLAMTVVLFSFTGKNFFAIENFQNIVHLQAVFLLLAAAETFVIITGGIDLSVGFVMGLSSVSAAKIMQTMFAARLPQWECMLLGSLVGLAVAVIPGFLSGLLIARYRVPPFIATLGMQGITNGITLMLCEGFPISFLPPALTEIGNGYLFYSHPALGTSLFSKPAGIADAQIREMLRVVPLSFLLLIVVLGLLWHLLRNTRFGLHTYAIGGSTDAALRSGINVRRHLLVIYTMSAFIAGIAGVFNVFQTGTGNFTPYSAMYEFFAIAGVVVGGASLMGGKGGIAGSIVGVLIIGVLENGLALTGVEPFWRFIAVGLILIVAIVLDQLLAERA